MIPSFLRPILIVFASDFLYSIQRFDRLVCAAQVILLRYKRTFPNGATATDRNLVPPNDPAYVKVRDAP